MNRSLARSLATLALGIVAACSLKRAPRPPIATYDLTVSSVADAPSSSLATALLVRDPVGAPWMDGQGMHYRLAYQEPARVRRYAGSRWAMSPLRLFGARLRDRLAAASVKGVLAEGDGGEADHTIAVEVETFEQVFDSPSTSRGVVRVRASLFGKPARRLLGQRTFEVAAPAPTADAAGGVRALARAGDEVVGQMIDWIRTTVQTQ